VISVPVSDGDLPGLRRLHEIAVRAAETLIRGGVPEVAELNALARGSSAHAELTTASGSLRADLVWEDSTVAGQLARGLIGELAAVEPGRLHRCARHQCDLVFYDTTRSRTQRWHAEDPCGWRERQHARRTRPAKAAPAVAAARTGGLRGGGPARTAT
jgi:predicted RNA-binding Zn ribbon-like protein